MARPPSPPEVEIELEVLAGLEPYVDAEMRGGVPTARRVQDERGWRWVVPVAALPELLQLRTAVAVYRVVGFDVARPKALLGHAHLTRLLDAIEAVCDAAPKGAFRSFRFSAAGRESPVFHRLAAEIVAETGLDHDRDEGDLLLRVRPGPREGAGWEVLLRLTPRPLSVRGWRVFDRPGALNATVAAAMVAATEPAPTDHFLDPMCGTGTLLVERAARAPAGVLSGCDVDGGVLDGARANLAAASVSASLLRTDATRLPFADATFDRMAVNLPWGTRTGTHESNATLYPATLAELARVAKPDARLVVLTHEVKVFEGVLPRSPWAARRVDRVFQKGHHPRLYVLDRA